MFLFSIPILPHPQLFVLVTVDWVKGKSSIKLWLYSNWLPELPDHQNSIKWITKIAHAWKEVPITVQDSIYLLTHNLHPETTCPFGDSHVTSLQNIDMLQKHSLPDGQAWFILFVFNKLSISKITCPRQAEKQYIKPWFCTENTELIEELQKPLMSAMVTNSTFYYSALANLYILPIKHVLTNRSFFWTSSQGTIWKTITMLVEFSK